jgi:hypothetical protein
MKRMLLLLIVVLSACAPEPQDLTISAFAKPFAKISLPTDKDKAFISLRNALDEGAAGFLFLGTLSDRTGFQAFWSRVAGQSQTVYFKMESNGENSVIRVLIEPNPPAQPALLARDLDALADTIRTKLSLPSYKFEPDR